MIRIERKGIDMSEKQEVKTSVKDDILSFLKVFVISACVIWLFVNFIAHPVTVDGKSMVPTLLDGEYGFTSIVSTYAKNYERGDVVVVEMNEDGKTSYWVKRIIGLPGETVEGKDGQIYIDGQVLDETWLDQDYIDECIAQYGYFNTTFDAVTLGEEQYFVMGDNRPVSKDSRDVRVGPVDIDQIYGKHVLVLFPFNKIGVH
jgi:signal peptidase I